MDCGCISVLMKDKLHPAIITLLRRYQKYIGQDSIWFTIRVKPHLKDTDFGRHALIDQLTEVFGKFPEHEVTICGQANHIFIAAHEIIRCFGGLMFISLGDDPRILRNLPGKVIQLVLDDPDHSTDPDSEDFVDRYLLDHVAIKAWATQLDPEEYDRYSLDRILTVA